MAETVVKADHQRLDAIFALQARQKLMRALTPHFVVEGQKYAVFNPLLFEEVHTLLKRGQQPRCDERTDCGERMAHEGDDRRRQSPCRSLPAQELNKKAMARVNAVVHPDGGYAAPLVVFLIYYLHIP